MSFLSDCTLHIGAQQPTQFKRAEGIRQDGTLATYRDIDGTLWAMAGHTNSGRIGMFRGSCISDLNEVWPISLNFADGHADYAFAGIRYPEGIRARGAIWPFGLYICPKTHRFFCFFHNETAWRGRGTGYDAFGYCEKPAFDSDFRHIGLMHSDDEGKSWIFDRWVLSAETVCFTQAFSPENDGKIGQPMGSISFGSGDFSIFTKPDDPYIYLFYNIIKADTTERHWTDCDIYVARTRKREDGVMGDFVKYYDGSFCEAGNLGKESPIALAGWHPKVVYLESHNKYLMSSSLARLKPNGGMVNPIMELRESDDLIHWSPPHRVLHNNTDFGGHYIGIYADDTQGQTFVINTDNVTILTNGNGTDIIRYDALLQPQETTN